jgi:dCMP deaminase
MFQTVTKEKLSKIDLKFITQVNEIKNLSVAEDKKVGAIIANHKTGELISIGYNKMFDDIGFQTCEDETGQSLPYVIHAEESAVMEFLKRKHNKKHNPGDLTLYCSYAPCINCAKYLSHLGIKRVLYDDKHRFKFDKCKHSPFEFLTKMNVEIIEVIKDFEELL